MKTSIFFGYNVKAKIKNCYFNCTGVSCNERGIPLISATVSLFNNCGEITLEFQRTSQVTIEDTVFEYEDDDGDLDGGRSDHFIECLGYSKLHLNNCNMKLNIGSCYSNAIIIVNVSGKLV